MQRKPDLEKNKDIDSFIMGAKDEKTNDITIEKKPAANVQKESLPFERKTYHVEARHIKAINKMSFHEELDKSEIVRRALDLYIPSKYYKD